jgi:hypothetical protein
MDPRQSELIDQLVAGAGIDPGGPDDRAVLEAGVEAMFASPEFEGRDEGDRRVGVFADAGGASRAVDRTVGRSASVVPSWSQTG